MIWVVSLSTMDLSTHSLTPNFLIYGIRSLIEFGKLDAPYISQCSTSVDKQLRLHLNAFRRERAISWFDWLFTPIPTSSPGFSKTVGSVLH